MAICPIAKLISSFKTYSVWRSTLILSFVSCYLMWAIVFMAQLHPLIAPKRADIRPDRVPE
ncbi:uncharacterized protein N7458_008484 [Penicillium daleae]|uniref:V-type proton ATPase subunit e n=1 Tax=Penicillium daleae TaxID=63821 RepID=A0AAD6G0Y6_9EURO|nr:uncharacterized protein N7458_008484 [Penicillium daleae]KAJ5444612.1 hypothetical protein N7458_008484 [Penicillium daleae]